MDSKESILKKLSILDNDPKFKFDPDSHTYTYDDIKYESVTRFIQRFHDPFDEQYWADYKANQIGVTKEEILQEWKTKNDRSNFIGHSIHTWIENYYNQQWQALPKDPDLIDRINKFNKIVSTHLHKLTPIKFEVRVFSKKWKISGMIDALFLYKGKVHIVDYKTNKKFTTDQDCKYGEMLRSPFDGFLKNHLNEYSIQISMYALLLKEYDIEVEGGILIHIGPEGDQAKMFKSIDMIHILENYLEN